MTLLQAVAMDALVNQSCWRLLCWLLAGGTALSADCLLANTTRDLELAAGDPSNACALLACGTSASSQAL